MAYNTHHNRYGRSSWDQDYNQPKIYTPEVNFNTFHRDKIYLRVCKTFESRNDVSYVDVYTNETIRQLKDKISRQLFPELKSQDFYLTLFDSVNRTWIKIRESVEDQSIAWHKIHSSSILNVVKHETNDNNQISSVAIGPTKTLTLKLCQRPMNRNDYIPMRTPSSVSLAVLKKQAADQITDQNTDHLYRWTDDEWIKYDQEVEDVDLEQLGFTDSVYISFDSKNRIIPGVCGLNNLGATCFINSALQCLSNIPALTKRILAEGDDLNAPLIGAYSKLIRSVWSGDCRIETPSNLLVSIRENLPKFARYRQQDAHEFMSYFLNGIHHELTNERTMISDLFYIKLRSNVTCSSECKSTEINEETIISLPLPVDNDTNQYSVLFLRSNGEQHLMQISTDRSSRTIDDLMKSFIVKYNLALSPCDIRAVGIYQNRIFKEYERYESLSYLPKDQLAFMELPQKDVHQKHIQLRFRDCESFEEFRPPVFLVCPNYQCRYLDVIDQIDTIRGYTFSLISSPKSPPYQLFWVNFERTRKLTSEKSSDDYLMMLDHFILDVDSAWVQEYITRFGSNLSPKKPSLAILLDDFFREEPLKGDYHCSKCNTMTLAKQKTDLIQPLPPVIIIQLKRFTYEPYSNDKIDTFIEYPLENLDLTPYIVQDAKKDARPCQLYNLVAVSNHIGSLSSGHYTTYAKNRLSKKWYLFNDDRYEEISDEKQIVNKNAYILIYVKQDQH